MPWAVFRVQMARVLPQAKTGLWDLGLKLWLVNESLPSQQLQMLGYDISWAAFNIIEVMSASKFTFKVVCVGACCHGDGSWGGVGPGGGRRGSPGHLYRLSYGQRLCCKKIG